MSLYKNYATDAVKEQSGVAVETSENKDGTLATFYISRMGQGNKRYSKALEVATRPYRRQLELGTMNGEIADRLFRKVFCETVLLGWANVTNRDEEYIEFSPEAALALFTDLPDLYTELQEKAKSAALFREESTEDETKN